MADTNRVTLAMVEETTLGTTPSNPKLQLIRVTDAQPAQNVTTKESAELRADRQIPDLIQTAVSAGGEINSELSYGNLDSFIEGAFCNVWSKKPSVPCSAVTATAFTVTGGTAFPKGAIVDGNGFTNAANNGLFVLTAAGAATSLTITGGTVETAPAGATVTMVGFQFAAGDCSATASGLSCSATSGDLTALGLQAGEWIFVGGSAAANKFGQAANYGFCRISVITATSITFDRVPAGWAVDAGTGKTIRIAVGNLVRNGTTRKTYTVERAFADIGQYEYFRGMHCKTLMLAAKMQDIPTAKVSFMGKTGAIQATRLTGATTVAAPTSPVMNTSSNVAALFIGGVAAGSPNWVMSLDVTIENNTREKNAVGSLGAADLALGQCNVSGNLDTYFGDASIYASILANTPTSLAFGVQDSNGAAYLIDVPRFKFKSGTPAVPGNNQDVHIAAPWQGIADPTLGYTVQMMAFPTMV